MKSLIASLRNLVLPFGATSGKRIVLNSDEGKIQLYNAANVLIAELTLDGPDNIEGVVSYGPTFPIRTYSALNGGQIEFGVDGIPPGQIASRPTILIGYNSGADLVEMYAFSGHENVTHDDEAFWALSSANTTTDTPQFTVNSLNAPDIHGCEFQLGFVSQGRGMSGSTIINANVTTVANTVTEVAAITGTNYFFRSGRAYDIRVAGHLQRSLLAGRVRMRLRRTNAVGTLWWDFTDVPGSSVVGADSPVDLTATVVRTAGTDLLTDVCVTIATIVAAVGSTARFSASAASPGYLVIKDVGAASDFPGAFAIT